MRFIGRSFAVYHYPLNNAVRLHFVYYIIVVAVRSLWACRLFLYCIMSVVPAPASGALASAAVILARATAHVPRKGWRCLVLVVARLFRCRARRAGGVSPANLRPALSLHKLRNHQRLFYSPAFICAPLWAVAFIPASASSLCPAGWCWWGCGRLCFPLLGCACCVACSLC